MTTLSYIEKLHGTESRIRIANPLVAPETVLHRNGGKKEENRVHWFAQPRFHTKTDHRSGERCIENDSHKQRADPPRRADAQEPPRANHCGKCHQNPEQPAKNWDQNQRAAVLHKRDQCTGTVTKQPKVGEPDG